MDRLLHPHEGLRLFVSFYTKSGGTRDYYKIRWWLESMAGLMSHDQWGWLQYIPLLVLKTKQLFTMLPLGLTFVRRQRQVNLNIFGQEALIGVWLVSPGASHVWDIILCNHLVYNIGLLYEEFCKWFGYKGMVSLSRRF